AIIATSDGTIVGCSDVSKQGMSMKEALPEYLEIYERVKASREHQSFTISVLGTDRIVFSNETSNGWQLILVVDSNTFYADIYRQMVMVSTIDLLMVVVIVVFYLVSINNQEKAENTLATAENFILGLSKDLTIPINDIVNTSDRMIREGDSGSDESIREIRETGKRLSQMMDNLLSYSSILKSGEEETDQDLDKGRRKLSMSSRFIRNGIIAILFTALSIGLVLCVTTSARWGKVRISREADKYNAELTQWVLKNQSILRMFTDVIAATPEVLDDYDSAVKWLNDIGKNYNEFSYCYIGNPYRTDYPVIMNNGWVPEPEYRVETRQWYIDTERSGDGYSISAPYYDAQTGLYCITFSRTVYSNAGDFLGIFAIDCYLDKLVDVLDDSYNSDGYAFLVDQNGNIINHPNKAFEISADNCINIEDTAYANVYHEGDEFGMKDYDGSYVSCFSQKSEISNFTVIVVQRWLSVYGYVIIMGIVFLIMLILAVGSVIALISRFIEWQEEANDKLVQAADAAVTAGKAKSRFLAQMSHEIRTPINAVLGMNEMILRESSDADIREYAGNIQTAGKNLLGLINSILDFSKIEEGKMEIIPVRYDTASMLNNLIHSVDQRAADKGLAFEVHIDEQLPSSLYGDDMRVSQVVINLLTNAVKYTAEGQVDMFVSGRKLDDESISLGFKVKDTGMGIKEEDLGRLFESFTRLDETRNRNIEGTGLGMAIVTKLLDMMGSKLEVHSEYGKGSEFSFEVVQRIEDASPIGDFRAKIREEAQKAEDETYVYAPKARVLAVDDNSMNLKVIKNLLKQNGIVPDMAESGEAALKLMGSNTYDMVLLDHMMPQMDGIETLQKAKEQNIVPDATTVIALTANAVVGARESYLAAGFDDYLSKPVEIKALEEALLKYLPKEITEVRKRSSKTAQSTDTKKAVSESHKAEAAETSSAEVLEFEPGGPGDEVLEFEPEDSDSNKAEVSISDIEQALNDNGISTKDGLSYCAGDADFYMEILSDYNSSLPARKEELENAFAGNDLEMYAIKVHALKSTAKTVGDTRVFEIAQKLEAAAKANDAAYVKDNHAALIGTYEAHALVISGLMGNNVRY
nr:response regulator [Lachnospiraceae bacterium]